MSPTASDPAFVKYTTFPAMRFVHPFRRQRGNKSAKPVVTLLLKNLNLYRVSLYEALRVELASRGIELRLVTATGMAEDAEKGDAGVIEWAEHRPFREIKITETSLLWQPGFDLAAGSDLIITEQASKQLFNIVLAYGQRLFGTRHAFWGHGRNFQASHEGDSGEGLKRNLTSRAHWFFSYNDLSSEAAIEAGMPADRVTPLMNSTDTRQIRAVVETTDPRAIREQYGFGDGPLGLFMAGLSPYKRPEFLLEAAVEIHRRLPDFELVIIGDGSMRHLVADAANKHSWIHWLGAMYGDRRLGPASLCSVQLMPGLVGLNIVDGFALGMPTITVEDDGHGPEIGYLENGVNGLMLPADSSAVTYATVVAEVLTDEDRLSGLREQADLWGQRLSIEDMVERFADGILDALAAPRRR